MEANWEILNTKGIREENQRGLAKYYLRSRLRVRALTDPSLSLFSLEFGVCLG